MSLNAALASGKVLVMGVLNVTPDSFSDGGRFLELHDALARARQMAVEGADIIDVGGESTRPGSSAVAVEVEMARVVPVIEQITSLGPLVSIDTRHARVADAALKAGASIVNDVAGLRDPGMAEVAARHGAAVVVVHSPVDDPATMQRHADYGDVVAEVGAFLRAQTDVARAAGVTDVVIDPGIGFGKTAAHNIELIQRLRELVAIGPPVLVGASRKRFIGALTGVSEPDERLAGSLAAHLAAVDRGARIVRVHDVAAHRQALAVWRAVSR